jgi:lipooligosaccharide transport system permease protein
VDVVSPQLACHGRLQRVAAAAAVGGFRYRLRQPDRHQRSRGTGDRWSSLPGLPRTCAARGQRHPDSGIKLAYAKLYDAILATPLGPVDIALGEIGWALLRGGMYSAGFLGVMLAVGLISSPWALLALPAALFVAFAFASIGIAATSFMRSWQDFDLVQLAVVPMFLFSATFFPLSVYPSEVQWLVQAFPLYHAVSLIRSLTTGAVGWSVLGHVAYFAIMATVGFLVASRRLTSLLLR